MEEAMTSQVPLAALNDPLNAAPFRPHAVLVTDGEQRSALAVVRTLGRAGHRVIVCSTQRACIAGASRYAEEVARVPDPLRDSRAFVESVSKLVRRSSIDVVIPMTDGSMLAALEGAEQLAPAVLPVAGLDCYRTVSDKAFVLAAAPSFGIAVPAQRTLALDDIDEVDEIEIPYPVVVKPARSVGEYAGRRARLGVQYAHNRAELRNIVRNADRAAFPLLLQQRVVGAGVGVFLLLWGGETIAVFSHRRLREKPPSGGVSVYRESVAADPDLVARSRALLGQFDWRGVAMIEYKIDGRTGTPYLMEINGRFWGSLQLAIDAGVDFPNLLLTVALDGARPRIPEYRVGVRSRWWWGDVDQLVTRLRRSAQTLALPENSPTRWQAVREFMRLGGAADHNEILRLDDPWPFVRETIDWFRNK
jgi:predicted ATP-grasp superfamily ATP-dependent carboligase